MKILYYSSHPNLNLASPSGYGTHMREMITAFEHLGHEVKPLIMGGVDLIEADFKIRSRSGFKKFAASICPQILWETAKDLSLLRYDIFAFKKLEKVIKVFQPDLIYERASYLQTSGVKAAKKYGIKHIMEVNSPYVEEREVLQGGSLLINKSKLVEQLQLQSSDKIVVVSTALQSHFTKHYGVNIDKFIVTPNAINPVLLAVDHNKVEGLRRQLQLADKTVIGFVGSIFPWHGVNLLIDAYIKMLKENEINTHLLIVGDGEILASLMEHAAQQEVLHKITFTGNVLHKDVFNYISLMDICVCPKSNWYGSPVKIFEYGALGKAIVAPDNVPLKDVMEHQITGLLVDPTKESIYNALNTYYQHPDLKKRCAAAFQKKVLEEHIWIKNAERVLIAAADD